MQKLSSLLVGLDIHRSSLAAHGPASNFTWLCAYLYSNKKMCKKEICQTFLTDSHAHFKQVFFDLQAESWCYKVHVLVRDLATGMPSALLPLVCSLQISTTLGMPHLKSPNACRYFNIGYCKRAEPIWKIKTKSQCSFCEGVGGCRYSLLYVNLKQ